MGSNINKKILIVPLLLFLLGCSNSSLDNGKAKINNINIENSDINKQVLITFNTNGGEEVKPMLYVLGDDLILPTPKKKNYQFVGWYVDNETFEKQVVNGNNIENNITLYAKWSQRAVPIYLDTIYDDEFEPIYKQIGDTFYVEELPTTAKPKVVGRLQFPLASWKDGGENILTEDFIVEDKYYEFHAFYGSPRMEDKYTLYENDFSTDYGYIDPNNSWERIKNFEPKIILDESVAEETAAKYGPYVATDIAASRELSVQDGQLYIEQSYSNKHYINNGAYLPEICYQNNEYIVETKVKFGTYKTNGEAIDNTFDNGFGIAVRTDENTGAYVALMLDPHNKSIRVAGRDNNNNGSGSELNDIYYPSSFTPTAYHTFKVKVSGSGKNTLLTAYFDGTQVLTFTNEKYFGEYAIGKKIALFATSCAVYVDEVNVYDLDDNIIYSQNFDDIDTSNLFDGWTQTINGTGTNHGEYNISNGMLNIDDAYRFANYHYSSLFYKGIDFKEGIISFDLTYNALSGPKYTGSSDQTTKYLVLAFKANPDRLYEFGSIHFRFGGAIQAYKHSTSSFSSWGSAIKTYRNNSDANMNKLNTKYHIDVVIDGNNYIVFFNGIEVGTYTDTSSALCAHPSGYIGLLASSISVSVDNLRISRFGD